MPCKIEEISYTPIYKVATNKLFRSITRADTGFIDRAIPSRGIF